MVGSLPQTSCGPGRRAEPHGAYQEGALVGITKAETRKSGGSPLPCNAREKDRTSLLD